VGAIPDAGVGYVLNPNGKSCYGQDDGRDVGLQTDAAASPEKTDTPAFPAVGHPAFGDFAGGVSFVAPAAGLLRALDLAVNEYQAGSQDFLAAWDASTGQFRPLFPARVNDLQFLTGPSVGDVDGVAGEELVGGTANLDLAAFSGAGSPPSEAWPKLTSDWMVANPLLGSFGVRETAEGARRTVVAMTRRGTVFAYATEAGACAAASWPRFHHDNANSGDYRRDATAPGRPERVRLSGRALSFSAPGDDLLCGRAAGYEVLTSGTRIPTGHAFSRGRVRRYEASTAAGEGERLTLGGRLRRWVGVRAFDEQGNVGRFAAVRVR
jgi:hypothetical protein